MRSPPNAVPTTTTVSGFPASSAYGAIAGVSGATFVLAVPIATCNCAAASLAFGWTAS
jgi:hypothetical protein